MINFIKRLFKSPEDDVDDQDYTIEELENLLLGSKTARKKQAMANVKRMQERGQSDDPRLPPGQTLTKGLPILDLGQRPVLDLETWNLSVNGLVENKLELNWEDFCALPKEHFVHDIHCVTAWSSYDQDWDGVSSATLIEMAKPKAEASAIMLSSYDGYTTNLTIEDFSRSGVLLADKWNGRNLPVEHGGPLRMVVPHLYFWKSAKWIKSITFMENEERGLWEKNGYHLRGDPWKQERYRAQEMLDV